MKCPIFSHEVYEDLGYYETDETDGEWFNQEV